MYDNDSFSKWLGIEIIEVGVGHCKLKMSVRAEMLNGFKIAHGSITFALADSALAFAANSHGRISVSLDVTVSYLSPAMEGDILTAVAEEIHLANNTAQYDITITNQHNRKIAVFRGTVYRTAKIHKSD